MFVFIWWYVLRNIMLFKYYYWTVKISWLYRHYFKCVCGYYLANSFFFFCTSIVGSIKCCCCTCIYTSICKNVHQCVCMRLKSLSSMYPIIFLKLLQIINMLRRFLRSKSFFKVLFQMELWPLSLLPMWQMPRCGDIGVQQTSLASYKQNTHVHLQDLKHSKKDKIKFWTLL